MLDIIRGLQEMTQRISKTDFWCKGTLGTKQKIPKTYIVGDSLSSKYNVLASFGTVVHKSKMTFLGKVAVFINAKKKAQNQSPAIYILL